MYLEQIVIENFRVFKSLNLKLNPGLNVLVGENDSGKTALIDAVRYVLGTNSSERTFLDESDFNDDSTTLKIQLKFVDVDKHAHIFVEHLTHEKISSSQNKRYPVLYVQLKADLTGREKRGYPYIQTEIKSGKDGNGLILDSEIRNFLSTTYLKPLRDAEAELSSGRGSRLSQILNSSKDLLQPESIDEILQTIADANSKLLENGKPIPKTSEKIQNLYLHKLIFEKDKESLKAIIDIAGIKGLEGLTTSKKRQHLRTILEGLNLSLTEERRKHGLGYNNLLFMAAELLLLEQEIDNEFPLLLIEEPEAHLHPQLQMKLLSFIIDAAKTKDNQKGIQCILSTHSPNISSKSDPENIILMNKGKAFSLRPEETELSSENYKFLKKFLDVTKANLFFARGVILVEGDSENILIPTIAKLIGLPLEDYGVSIVNIGSTAWKHFAKIFIRKEANSNNELQNPIKVSVIRDLDLWPACAEDTDENKYGFNKKKEPNGRKRGNLAYWLKEDATEQKTQIDTKIELLKKDGEQSLEKQNIKVCISDKWTFEYCLSFYGLFDECYEAINGSSTGKDDITGSAEEKATYIQSEVDKTNFAVQLANLLEKSYQGKPAELKRKLPEYIVKAIEHAADSPIPSSTAN